MMEHPKCSVIKNISRKKSSFIVFESFGGSLLSLNGWVRRGSGSFLELLLRPEFLLHPEQFLRIVLGSSFEMRALDLTETMLLKWLWLLNIEKIESQKIIIPK